MGVQGAGPACTLHSSPLFLQSFDESGRRTAGPAAMPSTIGFCLFSGLDDGMGYGCVEGILDCWHQEGVENSQDVLKVMAGLPQPCWLFSVGFWVVAGFFLPKKSVWAELFWDIPSDVHH